MRAVTESDEQLVERCRAGDQLAFRALFLRHRADVARVVARMTRSDSAELEDLVQEVFIQVHRSIGNFHGRSRLSTWIYRVAVNVVLMHRRAKRSRPTLVEESAASGPTAAALPLPDEQAAARARVRAFERLLERLSEKKRTVFILHELQGLTPKEIAEIVAAPVLTVRTRLFYARREIATLLDSEPTLATLLDEQQLPGEAAPADDNTRGESRR